MKMIRGVHKGPIGFSFHVRSWGWAGRVWQNSHGITGEASARCTTGQYGDGAPGL